MSSAVSNVWSSAVGTQRTSRNCPHSAHPGLSPVPPPLESGRTMEAQIGWTLRLDTNVTLCDGSKLSPAKGGGAQSPRKEPTLRSSVSLHAW